MKKKKMEESCNRVMGPAGRPIFKNRCFLDTAQGLRNLLMYHLLPQPQRYRRSFRTTKTLQIHNYTYTQTDRQSLLEFGIKQIIGVFHAQRPNIHLKVQRHSSNGAAMNVICYQVLQGSVKHPVTLSMIEYRQENIYTNYQILKCYLDQQNI